MERKQFSIADAISWGFKNWINQIMFFLLLSLVCMAVCAAVAGLSVLFMSVMARRMSEDNFLIVVLFGALSLVSGLFSMGLFLGLIKIMLDIYDHGKAEIKTLFSQGHLILPFMGASVLFAMIVGFGMAFFVIPGLYFFCRYIFFSYIMVDKGFGVLESFHESSRLTEGARWHILGLAVICGLLNIIPLLFFVTLLATVYAYRQQQENALQLPVVTK
jgi:uncharacterized membrane protein